MQIRTTFLPFSNAHAEGFENALARLVAADLGLSVAYSWRAQRRGFLREGLRGHDCDVVMAVPAQMDDGVAVTQPYYRSTYVFVSRADRDLHVTSFDDPALRTLHIGVSLAGDDGANPPPAHALGRRGLIDNVIGYSVYGDYRDDSPPLEILNAVARGEIDVAIVWGPLAGYMVRVRHLPLRFYPVAPTVDAGLPLSFAIAMGVRKTDKPLKQRLDDVLTRRRADIQTLLRRYGVPLVR